MITRLLLFFSLEGCVTNPGRANERKWSNYTVNFLKIIALAQPLLQLARVSSFHRSASPSHPKCLDPVNTLDFIILSNDTAFN